jgi:excisionase family DNA binding protein
VTPITERDLADALDVGEAAKFIGVSPSTINRMIANRELRIVRVGSGRGRVRITKAALLEHVNRKSA